MSMYVLGFFNESSIYMYIPYSLEIKVRFSYKYGGGAYN